MVIVSNLSNEPTDLTEITSVAEGSSGRVICVLLSPDKVKSTFGSNIEQFRIKSFGGTVNAGVSTAVSFHTNDVTGDGTDIGFDIKYNITSNGSSDYRFAGPGILNTVNDPTLYLQRGFTYIFNNTTGAHPFRIQFTGTTTGVGTYVSGSQTGTQYFTVPHDAPASYEYECTSHSSMKGSFIIPS